MGTRVPTWQSQGTLMHHHLEANTISKRQAAEIFSS